MYYSIVEKNTGRMQNGASNYMSDADLRPINEDELAIVPLNEELVLFLTTEHDDSRSIDFEKTVFNFETNTWNIIYAQAVSLNPVETKTAEINAALEEAFIKLKIVDLPEPLRTVLNKYVSDLTNLKLALTESNCRDTIVPPAPI